MTDANQPYLGATPNPSLDSDLTKLLDPNL